MIHRLKDHGTIHDLLDQSDVVKIYLLPSEILHCAQHRIFPHDLMNYEGWLPSLWFYVNIRVSEDVIAREEYFSLFSGEIDPRVLDHLLQEEEQILVRFLTSPPKSLRAFSALAFRDPDFLLGPEK